MLLTFAIVSIAILAIIHCSAVSAPTWLEKGAYVYYTYGSGYIKTPEERILFVNNTNVVLPYTSRAFDNAKYRWECIDINGTIAQLNVTMVAEKENITMRWTEIVFVNTLDRSVYLQNWTLVGTTSLWLPANPSPDDDIVLWNMPPDSVTLRIENRSEVEYTTTIQGKQKTFTVMGMGQIGGANKIFTLMCDFDTGLTVDGGFENEPTIKSLNITELIGDFSFSDTNIDLGPPNDPIGFRTIIIFAAVPAAFVITFVAAYRRRKGKHSH